MDKETSADGQGKTPTTSTTTQGTRSTTATRNASSSSRDATTSSATKNSFQNERDVQLRTSVLFPDKTTNTLGGGEHKDTEDDDDRKKKNDRNFTKLAKSFDGTIAIDETSSDDLGPPSPKLPAIPRPTSLGGQRLRSTSSGRRRQQLSTSLPPSFRHATARTLSDGTTALPRPYGSMRRWTELDARKASFRASRRSLRFQQSMTTTSSFPRVGERSRATASDTGRIIENPQAIQASNPNDRPYQDDEVSNRTVLPSWWQVRWSRARLRHTVFFCICSCIVLAVRLYLDSEPTAYLIHSIVVFLDMVLIHLFTDSSWLSISGELTTTAYFLAFHFTKETLYELLETTCLAILCSFHLIGSRNKHMEREEELETGVDNLRQQCAYLMRDEEQPRANMQQIHRQTSLLLHDIEALQDLSPQHSQFPYSAGGSVAEKGREFSFSHQKTESLGSAASELCVHKEVHETSCQSSKRSVKDEEDESSSLQSTDTLKELQSWFLSPNQVPAYRHLRVCGEHFFEHFLDGSAGVMYTSFLGLIIDEIIKQVTDGGKKC